MRWGVVRLYTLRLSGIAAALERPFRRLTSVEAGPAHRLRMAIRRLPGKVRAASKATGAALSTALPALLTHRHLPTFAAAIAMMLTVPTLWRGWGWSDDMLHRATLRSASLPEALSGLFVFLDPSKNRQLMDAGTLPWWTLETVRTAFFRPLAAFTHWLDYRLWPESALLMHAHSVLWYGCVCALTALIYRRLMGRTLAAGLAALIFAADIGHLSCVASLAGRNALLALLFGLLTLAAHDRWRQGGGRINALLAPLCLLLSLLSAEAGVGTGAYLLAYALFLDRGSWRQRLVSLLPYAAVAVVWRVAYQWLGYGVWGSGFYVDPVGEPLRFAKGALERSPVLLLGQWSIPEPGAYAILSMWASRAYWLVALLCVTLVGVMLGPLLRKDRVARFWGLGMLLAVVPVCAVSLPSGRLLIFVGLGAVGLIAQFVVGMLGRSGWLPVRRIWRIPAWGLCLSLLWFHAVVSPVLLSASHTVLDSFFNAITDIGPLPGAERRDVVIVNAPCPGYFIYVPSLRQTRDQPLPAHIRILAPGYFSVEVTRTDDCTLLVQPENGYLVQPGAIVRGSRDLFPLAHPAYGYQHGDGFFRGDAFPMALGQRVELTGMHVEVTRLADGGQPSVARVRFSRVLEDASRTWLVWSWEANAYEPFEPPAVGETVRISGPTPMWSPEVGKLTLRGVDG